MQSYFYWIYLLSIMSLWMGCEDPPTQRSIQEEDEYASSDAHITHHDQSTIPSSDLNLPPLLIEDMNTDSPAIPCTTQWRYDPHLGDELYAFPDDFYRTPAYNQQRASIHITPQTAPWIEEISDLVQGNFSQFVQLDGYGLNTGIFFKFTAPQRYR